MALEGASAHRFSICEPRVLYLGLGDVTAKKCYLSVTDPAMLTYGR